MTKEPRFATTTNSANDFATSTMGESAPLPSFVGHPSREGRLGFGAGCRRQDRAVSPEVKSLTSNA